MHSKLMRSLKVFTRTVELGRMSAAAEELHMTTSAVSQQLQKLERDLGLSLFNRNTRQLSLTEAGRVQYQSCRTILATAEQAQEDIEALQKTPSGKLKIIAPVGFGGGLMSEPMKGLLEDFPKLRLEMTFTDEPPNLIRAGADLALRIGPLADSSLVARHLVDWRMVLCVAPKHPLAQREVRSPTDLPDDGYIGHIRERQIESVMVSPEGRETLGLPRPRMVINNMQVVIRLIQDAVGYALLPEPEIQDDLKAGRLIQLLPDWQPPSYSVYAVAPSRETMPAKTRAVIDRLQAWFAEVSEGLPKAV
ncbi:LysR family transcriptional regulator [Marinimicrobium sp. ARAG 43.8]|uniref:LysR family transcriptional regulator n=1 Tax=Marinimicrobium sp. ARAG 43.8 TaxID=3418719 RepID=UPI003CEB2292